MNNLGSAMEAGDEDAAMEALEELDRISKEEKEEPSENEEAYPADPRWADVKSGETAAQYYDLFIKSGMTLGEVMEEIESSEEFFVFNPNLQQELRASIQINGKYQISLKDANDARISIQYDGEDVIRLTIPERLSGNNGDIYSYKDIPVIAVQTGGPAIYDLREKHPDAYRTALGTYEDITSMSSEDVENLKDTFFSGVDVELESRRETYEGHNYVEYTYMVPTGFLWNGYSMEEIDIDYDFTVDHDEDRVITQSVGYNDYNSIISTWTAE